MSKPRRQKTPKAASILPLFPGATEHLAPAKIKQEATGWVWTEQKAQLIARYLRHFVFITKHGAYIDGFSAPKLGERLDTWAANLVLQSEPQWLRQFYLCDLPNRTSVLEDLRGQQPDMPNRSVEIFSGDFNLTVHEVLKSPHLSGKTAAFCLLDQYSTECDWATVKAIALHKGPGFNKIEQFYFLAAGWIFRSLPSFKGEDRPRAFWGRDDWRDLMTIGGQNKLALAFTSRFEQELGYRFVKAWPIYEKEGGEGKIMFFMIHASDHEQAPVLMGRAYRNIVKPLEPSEQLMMEFSGLKGKQGAIPEPAA